MSDIMKINTYRTFIISKNNIIVEVNRNFLEQTGYTENELFGLTLLEASKLFRIDSQIDLQAMESDTTIFIFTKKLLAMEGIISCKNLEEGVQIFSFKVDNFDLANERFNLVNEFGTSQANGVAIFSCFNLVLVNSNQYFLDFLEPPFNNRLTSIGKSIMEISTGYLDVQFKEINDFVINKGKPYHIEEMYVDSRMLGESYWNITVVPVLDKDVIRYIILTLSSQTEKVLNRKEIEQRNQEFKTIIENINDETIVFDKDLNITHINRKIEKYWLKANIPLKNINDISKYTEVFDQDNQLIPYGDLPLQKVARGEFISKCILIKETSSGPAYREVNGSPIYNKDGEFRGGLMVYRDISDRINKEELKLIKAQYKLLTTVVESMNLEYVRCTYPELEIISINNNGMNKLKRINKQIVSMIYLIGKSYFAIYPIDEEKKRKELEFYLIEKGDDSYIDYENHIINGEKRYFKNINQPIFGLNNKIVEIIFITKDITDQVNAKNKIIETLDSQNQMFANISHELKTPLSMIFSSSQLIEIYLKKEIDYIVKEDISKSLDIIKQNSYRFTKLINNIIDLSSMEAGFYSLNLSNNNVIEVVENIVDSVRDYAKDKNLKIIFDTEIEEKIMAVDVDKMERIMLNLISNAIKFSPQGGNVYIDIKANEYQVDIFVLDYGAGIDKKDLNCIFHKYQKVDNPLNKNIEGSGIGLSLVKIMTELLGGKVSVESEVGEGTIFTINLPVKLLDKSEDLNMADSFNKTMDKINIEFSDISFD